MYLKAFIILTIILLGLFALVSTRPATFSVTRSTVIDVTSDKVFPRVANLRQWQGWSPWAAKDPDAATSFSGPDAAPGAAMTWSGNADVGEGTMTVTGIQPGERVDFRLEFRKPFEATHHAVFRFYEEDGRTCVQWTMSGKNGFIGKALSLFIDCDEMIGKDFEQGLASLKALVETEPPGTESPDIQP